MVALSLRPLAVADIPLGLALSSAAGWNQTAADWQTLLALSRAGSLSAYWDGQAAGTVTTVSYGQSLHWIGMVLVRENFRRKGIGTALLRGALEAVKDEGAVGLDATPAGKALYDTLEFSEVYRLGRWLREPFQAALPGEIGSAIEPMLAADLPAVCAYDQEVFGADRAPLLRALRAGAAGLAWLARRQGRTIGYCLGRFGRLYAHIGPVVADDTPTAQALLLCALDAAGEWRTIVDTTFHRPEWNEWLRALGFAEQRPFMRMRLGAWALPVTHGKQLAVAGPEFG